MIWLLLWCCSLQISGAADENKTVLPKQSRKENETITDKILENFQQILITNGLPRVTKGEVVTLLEDFARFSAGKLNRTKSQHRSPPVRNNAGNGDSRTGDLIKRSSNFERDTSEKPFSGAPEGGNGSRSGYERDLMVVMPVMPDNPDISRSKLEMLYTKTPVTEMIYTDESSATGKPKEIKKYSSKITTTSKPGAPAKRHPYTEFLFSKPGSRPQKSPLDYGYPETLKFVEELNELPKNHKPDWATTDTLAFTQSIATTTEDASADTSNPFEMFESVKPMEINKLLSTVSTEETQEPSDYLKFKPSPNSERVTPTRKTPPKKKPTKIKATTRGPIASYGPIVKSTIPSSISTFKGNGFHSTRQSMPTSPTVHATRETANYVLENSISSPNSRVTHFLPTPLHPEKPQKIIPFLPTKVTREEILNTAQSTHFNIKSTKEAVLPTLVSFSPYSSSRPPTSSTSSTTTSPTTTTTTTTSPPTTTAVPQSSPEPLKTTTEVTVVKNLAPITEEPKIVDSISSTECSKPDPEIFAWNASPVLTKVVAPSIVHRINATNAPIETDMLNNDMKNVLIALGILKDPEPTTAKTIASKQEELHERFLLLNSKSSNAVIDPNSYSNFKKIPDQEEIFQSISNDMQQLLASFGLQPKTRISRQFDLKGFNSSEMFVDATPGLNASRADLHKIPTPSDLKAEPFTVDVRTALEDLNSIQAAYSLNRSDEGKSINHVFKPSAQLEELNKGKGVQKINEIIDNIRKLSRDKNTNKLTTDEVMHRLENITSLLNSTDLDKFTHALNRVMESQRTQMQPEPGKDLKTFSDVSPDSEASAISSVTLQPEGNFPNKIMVPPNPLSSEELKQLYESSKNDVKRQQPQNTSADATTTTEGSTSVAGTGATSNETVMGDTSSTTEITPKINNNAPIPELAASFGGGETASEAPTNEDISTPKPNGLYFYLDWNSFLNVGEADKNPVNIRFSPKAGNARNFIPITFP